MDSRSSESNPSITTPTIKTHEEPGDLDRVTCGICQRQISRYTCPSCNLLYCSLKCFRSEPHSQCSEMFYRKEIEIGVRSDSSKAEGDRRKILDLLKRMEEQAAAGEDGLFHLSDEENEEETLADRFSAMDISSASPDDILRLLTEKEREDFFAALKDPSSGLARELLGSADLDKTRQLPWWEAPSDGGQSSLPLRIPYGAKPELMTVPADLVDQASRGVSLLYNICAVFLAYTYVTRHLAMSPLSSGTNDPQDRREARDILSRSVPFLVDRKSKLLYTSLTDVVVSFWSRLKPGSIDDSTVAVLLEDVAKIIRPQRITVTGHPSGEQETALVLAAGHPFATTVMAMSDVSSLFSNSVDPSAAVRRRSHVEMKLVFYAAHIMSAPSSRLHGLADELLFLSMGMRKEA